MSIAWQKRVVATGLRLDALDSLGENKLISASRLPMPGLIFRADNYTDWRHVSTIGTTDITSVASAGSGVVFAMDRESQLYRSVDYGDTWTDLGRVSNSTENPSVYRAYGMIVTVAGTLLISDMRNLGGKIFRSTNNGTSFTDLGAIGTGGLYLFSQGSGVIIVGDLTGRIFKSTDDGANWTNIGRPTTTETWGCQIIDATTYLTAHADGKIYRTTDSGSNWTLVHTMAGAADCLITDGTRCVCSTYTSGNVLYESSDAGVTWASVSAISTQSGDYLSRAVVVAGEIVGTTEQGFAIYSDTDPADTRRLWDLNSAAGDLWIDASESASLFDATSGGSVVAADGTIARAEDQSGSTRHITQSTSGKRPLRKTAQVAALDVMRFDGSDDSLGISSTDLAQNAPGLSVFVVAKITNPTTTSFFPLIRFRTGADVDRAGMYVRQSKIEAGGRRADADSYQFVQHGSVTASQPYVFGAVFDWTNATLTAYLSGAGTARSGGFQTSGSSGNIAGRMDVGGHLTSSSFTITGDVCEIFATNVAVDTDTRQKIEGRLHWKWGLQYLLPFDHPYKAAPPLLSGLKRPRINGSLINSGLCRSSVL